MTVLFGILGPDSSNNFVPFIVDFGLAKVHFACTLLRILDVLEFLSVFHKRLVM